MSESSRAPAVRPAFWLILFLVTAIVAVSFIKLPSLFFFLKPQRNLADLVSARNDVMSLRVAVRAYSFEYGSMPAGNHPQIMKTLRWENPHLIRFFEAPLDRFNALGEFLDPWGNPYRMDVSNPNFPWFYSFGPNGTDDGGAPGSDDVTSW
jgi:hypothetical protein